MKRITKRGLSCGLKGKGDAKRMKGKDLCVKRKGAASTDKCQGVQWLLCAVFDLVSANVSYQLLSFLGEDRPFLLP